MSCTVVIHQPEYFPWLGFLDKARQADVLVFLDSVQFDRSSLQHRAKILGAQGPVWLTMPFVHRFPQDIDEVTFADRRWAVKHQKSIQSCYGRAAGFARVGPQLANFFDVPRETLSDATVASCELLLDAFGVRPKVVVRSRTLDVTSEKADLVAEIVQRVGGDRYLSGRTGATYLDRDVLASRGIELSVQRFEMRPYGTRRLDQIVPGLSALDAWALLGDSASTFFAEGGIA